MSKDTKKELPASSKMRLRLYSPEDGSLISDRLVEQTTEFMGGPKETHKGAFSVELNLMDQTQVDSAIEYLKKLKGDLPIAEISKPKSTTKTIDKMLSEKEPLLDLLKTIKGKGTTQEKMITMLREYNFRFISGLMIQDMSLNDPNIAKQLELREKDITNDYQYMVRLVKEAKEPLNDKYDFRLVFGIKIVGEKRNFVQIYLWGEWAESIKVEWENAKKNNFKKVEKMYVFPEFMDYADRKKWRSENRKKETALSKGLPFEESKAFKKWTPYVKGL